MRRLYLALFIGAGVACIQPAAALTLREAVRYAVHHHPAVGATVANRDAVAYQLRQAQGRLLPSVDAFGDAGPSKIDRPHGLAEEVNNEWQFRRQIGVTMRQVLFEGFDRANDIYRNAARLDAAALRILDRSETLALDAVEAYIDYRRHSRLLEIARRNVRRHSEIVGLVGEIVKGGKAPESDLGQAQERLAAAKAITAQVEESLLEAQAKFHEAIGLEPKSTQAVSYPPGIPKSKQAAVDVGLAANLSILAASADIDAAKFALEQARSGYYPRISLEATASAGEDLSGTPGRDNELIGRVVLEWNLFQGFITDNRVHEEAARVSQAEFDKATRARTVREAIERAFAIYTAGAGRVAATRQQLEASRSVVAAYQEEYNAGKRSLLDLLDAEAAQFSTSFQLSSAEAVHLFSAYQVLASIGRLLTALEVAAPAEAVAGYREKSEQSIFHIDIEPLRQ